MADIRKFKHKIRHQYGRRYYGYLTPVEIIELAQCKGVNVDKRELQRALDLKISGVMGGRSYGFDIIETSSVFKLLNEKKATP